MKKIILYTSSFFGGDNDKLLEIKLFSIDKANYKQILLQKEEIHNEIERLIYGNSKAITAFIQVLTHGGARVSIPLNRYFKLTANRQYSDWNFDPEWIMERRFEQTKNKQHQEFLDDANTRKEELIEILPKIRELIKKEVNSIDSEVR